MPNRIVREGINDSDRMDALVRDAGWSADAFYRRLLNVADDYGRFDARLSWLKSKCYPTLLDMVRDNDLQRWIAACEKAGLVRIYSADSKTFGYVVDFKQVIRAERSKFPDPPSENAKHMLSNGEADDKHPNSGCALRRIPKSKTNTTTPRAREMRPAADGGNVVVVSAAPAEPQKLPPDPAAIALLHEIHVTDSVIDSEFRSVPYARVRLLVDAGESRIARQQISRDQLAGFVVEGLRKNYDVAPTRHSQVPPEERQKAVTEQAGKARDKRMAERKKLESDETEQRESLRRLDPSRLAALKSDAIAGAAEFLRPKLESEDPVENPMLRALVIKQLESGKAALCATKTESRN